MNKVKLVGFLVGFLMLVIIIQYQFLDNDSWDSWNLPLAGKIIVLDPGHGGPDGGAVGGEVLEKDVSLSIAVMLKDYFQEQGALVLLTREKDKDLAADKTKGLSRRKAEDLRNRVDFINESSADLYISIHLNSIPSARWSGAQTFYYGSLNENEYVSKYIQDELRKNLENTNRKAKAISSVYLLKHAKRPGALVEVGFLSNPGERSLLANEDYQEKIAISIYKGTMRYFTNESNPPD